ncbi:thioesterase [Tissierella carlieri]|uniref:Thioesterase n=1 Tax=Tissierella carlieri TaxID=689904 RepID=A0ABT1SCR2_9FIRM|nr:acyl-ACP thioesterase domain-containing protein [Tissierella carlieri]MCQ4924265.1 thioesterase [Tissierella carlieri]
MSKYKKMFQIPYYDADKYRRATPIAILTYLGETSGAHTDHIGFGVDKLQALNYGWMLNRWKVKIRRYPNVKENITIETWTSGVDKFYATREFIIYDEKAIEIGRASTVWIFLNMEKKRPIRVPAEFIKAINPVEEKTFDDFYDFKKEIEIEEYIDFHVRRSDIDYNNHVNNTKYLSWMLETIPEYIYENYMLEEFEILYKKETTYGNTILSGSNEVNKTDDLYKYFHNILDKDNKENHSMGVTKWKNMNK